MTYGIEVKNDSDVIIIDSEHRQLSLIKTEIISFTHDSSMYVDVFEDALGSGTVDLPTSMLTHHLVNDTGYSREDLVVGFQCNYGVAFTDPWSTDFYTLFLEIGAPANTTATIYFFHPEAVPVNSSYGLAIYNTAGATMFNSNYKYMRIKDVISLSMYGPFGSCGAEDIVINGVSMDIMGWGTNTLNFTHAACSNKPIIIPPSFPATIGIEPTWFPEYVSFLAIGFKNISTTVTQLVMRCGTTDAYMNVDGDPSCTLDKESNSWFPYNETPATAMHFQVIIVQPW